MLSNDVRRDIRDAFRSKSLTVQAVQSDGTVGWFPVEDVVRHVVPHKTILRVVLEGGQSVDVTEDHSLFTDLIPIRAEAVREGLPLTTVQEDKIVPCAVVSIAPITNPGVMYDLCVPGPQNFVLTNGILAHNSYSVGGISLDLDKSSKYESAQSNAQDQFTAQLERAKATVNVIKGLQQPRYGSGMRSAFGPYTGRGVLTPARFLSV